MGENHRNEKVLEFYGGPWMSTIPILVYILVSACLAIFFQFYSMKGLVFGAFLGLLLGFVFVKNKSRYWDVLIGSLAKFSSSKLIFTFIVIGIFTRMLTVGDIGTGFVWLSVQLHITGGLFVIFTFLATAVISMGAGAPIAAVFAVVPIFFPPGILLGARPPVLVGAMMSGVFFGDAMSPSSQVINTTVDTQHDPITGKPADLQIVMKQRSPYLISIAILSILLFGIFGAQGAKTVSASSIAQVASQCTSSGLWMLIPIVILIVISFKKKNLFLALSYATITGLILGLITKVFKFSDIVAISKSPLKISGIINDGIYSMVDIIISTILLFGMIEVAVESGFVNKLCNWLLSRKFVQTKRGASSILILGVGIINVLLSGCVLPAILLFGNIADRIGKNANISADKRTYLLTGMATSVTAIIPINSAFVMGAITLINNMKITATHSINITPLEIFQSSYYCILLTLVCIIWIFVDQHKSK
ncbi:hypothetical protein [Pediococcus stilesii]|nr:hypothetical protein [Pediococcus stilesii]